MQATAVDPVVYPRIVACLEYMPSLDTPADAYIVKDPRTARYFRLSHSVIRVMQLMDGSRTLDAIASAAHISSDTAAAVLARLEQLRLLDDAVLDQVQQSVRRTQRAQRTWIRRLFFVRKDIDRADVWLTTLYNRLRLGRLFRPWAGGVWIALLICAALLYLADRTPVNAALARVSDLRWMPLWWLVWAGTAVLHELAHAATCKHFGGAVRSMGVGIYYFNPVFFCDVSDAWMFPQRWQRLLTHSAGLAVNFALAALAVLLAPLAHGTVWEIGIGAVVLVCGFVGLLNLNPLLRMDGYFLLAELLRIDNLRDKAFSTLALMIARLGYRLGWRAEPTWQAYRTPYERRILLLYGAFAMLYALGLLAWLAHSTAYVLAQYLGPAAWIISYTIAATLFVLPWRHEWRMQSRRQRSRR